MCDLLNDIGEKLSIYDRIYVFSKHTEEFERVFVKIAALETFEKEIWVYSCNKIQYPEGLLYRRISVKEAEDLLQYYFMYEFSDKFYAVCYTHTYGSLFHYMNVGLLTMEEAAESLLY